VFVQNVFEIKLKMKIPRQQDVVTNFCVARQPQITLALFLEAVISESFFFGIERTPCESRASFLRTKLLYLDVVHGNVSDHMIF
jgi:hypothetical protein